MKVIPCVDISKLEGSTVYTDIEKEIKNYQKRSIIGTIIMIVSLAFLLPFATLFALAFLSADGIIAHGTNSLTAFLSPSISDVLANIIGFIFSFLSGGLLVAIIVAIVVIPLWYLYLSIRSATDKRANVAKALYISERVSEVEHLLLPPVVPAWAYEAVKKWTTHGDIYSKEDQKGLIIAKTPLTSLFVSGKVHSKQAIITNEIGFETTVKEQGNYAIFFFDFIIAIVDKKYKKDIINKIEVLRPGTLKSDF